MKVEIKTCKEFKKSLKEYQNNKAVLKALVKFSEAKEKSPNEKYGSKDYKVGAGPLSKYWHSGLTFDVSVFYLVERDKDTYTFYLYGVYSHDDAGTGQPNNVKRQQSLASKLDHQEFV